MIARDLRKLFKKTPFEPVRMCTSDGRAVLIRHPEQVVVSDRHVYVGLATLESSRRLATPKDSDSIGKDWLWISILHVSAVEPAKGRPGNEKSRGRRNRKE